MVLRRVAVTGATGMLGTHLVEAMVRAGLGVQATSLDAPGDRRWDLRDWRRPEELDTLFGEVDAVVHAGAIVPGAGQEVSDRDLFDANVRSCLCIGSWALARRLPLVFISGATVYADLEAPSIPESAPKTCHGFGGLYGATKRLAECVLERLAADGLALCVLRPSSIYGAGQDEGKLVPRWLGKAERDGAIELSPPVEDRVDLVHASDVASAVLGALEANARGPFNVASGKPVSMSEIALACVAEAGGGSVTVADGGGGREPTTRFALDIGAARDAFGFTPGIDLATGLALVRSGRCS